MVTEIFFRTNGIWNHLMPQAVNIIWTAVKWGNGLEQERKNAILSNISKTLGHNNLDYHSLFPYNRRTNIWHQVCKCDIQYSTMDRHVRGIYINHCLDCCHWTPNNKIYNIQDHVTKMLCELYKEGSTSIITPPQEKNLLS
jgi:hypothetical protein